MLFCSVLLYFPTIESEDVQLHCLHFSEQSENCFLARKNEVMASLAAQIKEANVEDIHRVVQCNGDKYLCFTRLAATWLVNVTDGVTLWRVNLDDEEVDALRDLAGVNTVEAYLTRFRFVSVVIHLHGLAFM